MKKRKTFKIILGSLLGIGLLAGIYIFYLWNMPHRDVTNTESDYKISANQLVNEYLADAKKADDKYLDAEGESKIFEVSGRVSDISEDFEGQTVILLKNDDAKSGVSCTFSQETKKEAKSLKTGSNITIKGVIRSGASYDADLEMYENVILDKCSLVK